MLKKLSEKLRAKFPVPIYGNCMVKFASKPSRRPITAAKRTEKEKKGRRNKIPKIKKPKDVGHFLVQKHQNFYFCACPSHNALKHNAGGKKGKLLCCKSPKCPKNALFAKSSRSQWVNII